MSEPICVFCEKIADTKEHIPAKHFFKGVQEKELITVPSCHKCNASFQKDEVFFRQFNAGFLMDRSPAAKDLMDNEITRSIRRRPALAIQMFNQMKLVDAYTGSGIYLGKKTAYKISDFDRNRIDRVVKKIIQGLFFHEFNQILPKDWIIRVVWVNLKVQKELNLIELEKTLRWKVIKEDIFAYGLSYVPKSYQSIWMLDFFKVPLFYALVYDRKL